jgi:DnaJ family protein C protein 3
LQAFPDLSPLLFVMRVSLTSLAFLSACLHNVHCLQASDISADTPLPSLISSAKAHLAGGSPRDALLYFDAAITRDPTNYLTIFQRGATYLSLGRDAQATEDFNRVLDLKPDFEGALLQRARIKTRSADWAGARRDLVTAGKRSSAEYAELEEAQAAAGLAEEAERKGDWEKCVTEAGIAIMKANTALNLRQMRARCRFEKGDIQEALSDLVHVLQIAPGLVEPHLQISSMLFYALGDTDRGVAQIRKCLHSDPDSKACSRLFRREKQIVKRLEQLLGFMEKRKFSNAANLMVGNEEESGLIEDVRHDVEEARESGLIHPRAPDNLYIFLIESACEAYRGVCSLMSFHSL